jgi:hypothetical protein
LVTSLAGTDGVVIGCATVRVGTTEARTYRDALPLEPVAVHVLWTVRVDGTLFGAGPICRVAEERIDVRVRHAVTGSVTEVPWGTVSATTALTAGHFHTLSPMISHGTILPCPTSAYTAGIDTLAVLTSLLRRTLPITPTPYTLDAAIVSIYGEPWGTEFTRRFMIFHHTGSVSRAGVASTGVLALVADAGLVPRASTVLQADGD